MPTPIEKWVEEVAALTQPKNIFWCTGSADEAFRLVEKGIKEETIEGRSIFYPLNHQKWPNAYLHRSHHTDVARTENLTFVCHSNQETTGPNNHWMTPAEAKTMLTQLSKGCMRGKTMYVVPFVIGHPDSPFAKFCVQLTDVSYVAVNMYLMTRMGKVALNHIGNRGDFIRGIHSVGDFDPHKRFIMHFPEEKLIWSVGSGYGGNALLGKKCIALRLASWIGFNEGWLAEHMIVIGVEDPNGKIHYFAAAFPSACGKTNLAMLRSTLPSYKVWTLGDDIAWLRVGKDGRLWAMNAEMGFFGVAPGTSDSTNPVMMQALKSGGESPVIFTNTALDQDTNEPWWEGLTEKIPDHLLDWQGNSFIPVDGKTAAHPNSRFTVSIRQCPTLSKEFENPEGVPISGIIFGGRRTNLIPLVYESFNWQHGVYLGATLGSETTAATTHAVGILRKDPMAMLPFCGYDMGDYFAHWLRMGKKLTHPPKVFFVNWFRKDENGKFLWPGFGENIRVLKWIIDRSEDKTSAKETPIGLIPQMRDLDLSGLNLLPANVEKLFSIADGKRWGEELTQTEEFFRKFGARLPDDLQQQFNLLKKNILLTQMPI